MVEHEIDDRLPALAGHSGDIPGELSTKVPHEHKNISSIRAYLLDFYKTEGLKQQFRRHGQDVIGYYSGHKLQILAGVGIAGLITVASAGGFVIYRQRKRR